VRYPKNHSSGICFIKFGTHRDDEDINAYTRRNLLVLELHRVFEEGGIVLGQCARTCPSKLGFLILTTLDVDTHEKN
jgi:hypothetical protein